VPMRTLQEWMGHRNLATTEIYADYAPDPAYGEAFAESAFAAAPVEGSGDGRIAAESHKENVASGEDAGVASRPERE
jgi:hypothetical protein